MFLLISLIKSVLGDCNPYCISDYLENNSCDTSCMTGPCEFDKGFCDQDCFFYGCSKLQSDGICDEECNTIYCGFDHGDCSYCLDGCTKELFFNDACDPECNNEMCLYDNYNCGYCASGCFENMLGNGQCENECLVEACGYDLDDYAYCSVDTIYVTSEDVENGDGSLENPFNNIFTAFYSRDHFLSEVLLLGTKPFDFYDPVMDSCFTEFNYVVVSIKPLYCDEVNIPGCFQRGDRPILMVVSHVTCFFIMYNIKFIDVIFSQDELLPPYCETCNYCKYTYLDGDIRKDDRNNNISDDDYVPSESCEPFGYFPLLYVYQTGSLELMNVQFENMRLGYLNLIYSYVGSVALYNVNFTNIATSNSMSVIHFDLAPYYTKYFTYIGGIVELLNNGYEIINSNPLTSFMTLQTISSVTISQVTFRNNLSTNTNNGFINMNYCISVKLSQLYFHNNYVKSNVIGFDESLHYYSTEQEVSLDLEANIYFSDCKFENNTAETLIRIYYKSNCQSLKFDSLTFINNQAKLNLIDIYHTESISELCINGGLENGYLMERKFLDFINGNFVNNFAAGSLINLNEMPNVALLNSNFEGNGVYIDPNEVTIKNMINDDRVYMQNGVSEFEDRESWYLISFVDIYRLEFANNSFEDNVSPLIELTNIFLEISFEKLSFKGNVVSMNEWFVSISSAVPCEIRYLEFFDNTFVLFKKALVYLQPTVSNAIYKISHVRVEKSAEAFRVQLASLLDVYDLTVLDSKAELYSVLYFTGTTSATLTIADSSFIGSSGVTLYLTSEISGSSLLLAISNSLVSSSKGGNEGLFIDSSLKLTSNSIIKSSKFTLNHSPVLSLSSNSGELLIIDCIFEDNQLGDLSLIKITGQTKVNIQQILFKNNSAESLIYIFSFNNSTVTYFTQCDFENNQGTAIKLSNAVAIINDSIFNENSGDYGSVAYLTNQARMVMQNVLLHKNVVEANGVICLLISSYIEISDSVFTNNTAYHKGGSVFADMNSQFFINNSSFLYNSALQGSSIFIQHSQGNSQIKNSVFMYNSVQKSGTISTLESILSISDSIINANTGLYYPALEVLYFSKVIIENSQFSQHSGEGAHISLQESSELTIFSSTFSNSFCEYTGCAFTINKSYFSCHDCHISSISSNGGSAIYCEKSKCTFQFSLIQNVTTLEIGAIIWAEDSTNVFIDMAYISNFDGTAILISRLGTLEIQNSKIEYGISENGAGIFCKDCSLLQIQSSTFSNLHAYFYGGCLYINPSTVVSNIVISNSNFFLNSAQAGGSIFSINANLSILFSNFSNNHAFSTSFPYSGQGGSIFVEFPSSSFQLYLENTSITNNTANISGGAIQWYNNMPVLINCVLIGNTAQYGQDLGSYPSELLLVSSRLLGEAVVAPGQQIENPFIIKILDHYKQPVITESAGLGQISVSDAMNFSISGEVKVMAQAGMFTFSSVTITGKPNSTAYLTIIGTFSSISEYTSLTIEAQLRDCVVGEALISENTCVKCEYGKYNMKPGGVCKSCPLGATCLGGDKIFAAAGYWRYSKQTDVFINCLNPSACLIESENITANHCLIGYFGNLCQSCIEGYSRSGENECTKCLDEDRNIGFLIGMLILLILITGGLTASSIRSADKDQSITSIYFKILINYFQLVMLTVSLNLDWPNLVRNMLTYQSKAVGSSDQLFSIDCFLAGYGKPYYSKLIMLSLIPIICCLCSISFWLLWGYAKKSPNLKEKIFGSIIIQLFIFQPSLLKYNFSMFNCMELAPGEYFLMTDLQIKCWDSEHLSYTLAVALPSLVVWCMIAPGLLFVFMRKKKFELGQIHEKLKYGFLYKGFKPERYYWEFFIMMRKFLIISAAVFLKNVSVKIQALVTFVVILVAYILQNKLEPFNFVHLNQMELRAILVGGVSIYSGMFFLTKDLGESGKDLIFAIMLFSNIGFLSYWAYYTFGFYVGKICLKFSVFKKLANGKFSIWISKVLPENNAKNQIGPSDYTEIIKFQNSKKKVFTENQKFNSPFSSIDIN